MIGCKHWCQDELWDIEDVLQTSNKEKKMQRDNLDSNIRFCQQLVLSANEKNKLVKNRNIKIAFLSLPLLPGFDLFLNSLNSISRCWRNIAPKSDEGRINVKRYVKNNLEKVLTSGYRRCVNQTLWCGEVIRSQNA